MSSPHYTPHYLMIVEEAPGEGYSAYFPDIPGVIATGRDLMDLVPKMEFALRRYLDACERTGKRPPLPKTIAGISIAPAKGE